ncbi:hypothetical protein K438DRAFT_882043 [Mycena galopus ATCC 62051]|nr:hypothetical protein K438DRAFT_882043 [Mycena galopus ATCC 62051]
MEATNARGLLAHPQRGLDKKGSRRPHKPLAQTTRLSCDTCTLTLGSRCYPTLGSTAHVDDTSPQPKPKMLHGQGRGGAHTPFKRPRCCIRRKTEIRLAPSDSVRPVAERNEDSVAHARTLPPSQTKSKAGKNIASSYRKCPLRLRLAPAPTCRTPHLHPSRTRDAIPKKQTQNADAGKENDILVLACTPDLVHVIPCRSAGHSQSNLIQPTNGATARRLHTHVHALLATQHHDPLAPSYLAPTSDSIGLRADPQ